jgi:hypothetical protein
MGGEETETMNNETSYSSALYSINFHHVKGIS